ncbi:MAG TPA: hypothetical protein VKH61_19780 [Streptosporangiaceae bacterium]|nr:hypothetical protein [Streptosporangiaceae bacterium]
MVARPIAFVISDVTGPSFNEIIAAVEREAANAGRLCLVCTTHGDPERESAVIDMLRVQGASAVILVGGAVGDKAYRARMARYARSLESSRSRLVLCSRPQIDENVPASIVDYDNRGGAFSAARFTPAPLTVIWYVVDELEFIPYWYAPYWPV